MKIRALNATKPGGSNTFLQTGLANEAKEVKYENTYRMGPEAEQKIMPSKVTTAIQEELDDALSGRKYNKAEVSRLIAHITDRLRVRVRDILNPRYKFVCHVVITEKKQQSVNASSMCLWNPSTDSFASATFENGSLLADGVVYGVYFE